MMPVRGPMDGCMGEWGVGINGTYLKSKMVSVASMGLSGHDFQIIASALELSVVDFIVDAESQPVRHADLR